MKKTSFFQTLTIGLSMVVALALPVAAEKITFIGMLGSFQEELQEAIDNFTRMHGIEVELIVPGGWPEVGEKVIVMTLAGTPPDVIYTQASWFKEFADRGILKNLNNMIAADNLDMGLYPPRVIDFLTYKGAMLAMPTAVSPTALFINKDLFDQQGLDLPTASWDSQEWTFDDYLHTAKKLTIDKDGDGRADQFGTQSFGPARLIGCWGLHWVDDERTTFLGALPDRIEAINILASFWTDHGVVGGNFLNCTAAITINQGNFLNTLLSRREGLFNWTLAPVPKAITRASQTGFHNLSIHRDSPNAEMAWELIKYLAYDRDGNRLFTTAENRTPVQRYSAQLFLQRWYNLYPASRVDVLIGAFPYIWEWKAINGYNSDPVRVTLENAITNVTRGLISARAALEEITPVINGLLREKPKEEL